MADRNDDQIPGQAGPDGEDVPTAKSGACEDCGAPLAPDQRYCLSCGARRGRLPGAVAGTVAALSSKGKAAAAAAAGKGAKEKDKGDDGDGGGWSWMPSPPAIAIAVIGMLALGVGLGSAMSEIASSAPLSTILLEYPGRATEAPPPAEEPEEEFAGEETEFAEAPEEAALPEEIVAGPLPEEIVEEPLLPEEPIELPEEAIEEENPFEDLEKLEEREKEEEEAEAPLPEVKHAFLIVLGEGGYGETFGAASGAPYLSRVLPKKGELLPNYYGVTSGVLANEIALLSGQGPTPETAANCPDYTPIAPGTVSVFAAQVEGNGCVYGKEVESLPTQLEEKELTWRAYVQDMENGGAIGQPWRCRKPVLGESDTSVPSPEDLYVNWRNPVVYFSAIAESDECEKHDVGFEPLAKDLRARKKTPTLSLIFPEASALKTLVPSIMASPAYEEGGLIMITSAQAPQAGAGIDQKSCCLVPEYPNLPPVAGATPAPAPTEPEPEEESTTAATLARYTEESVLETGGGGKVGLLMISPFVEAGKVEEAEYANHFTLLKTLETMLGVEPIGYAGEEKMPALSAELFTEPPVTQSPKSAAEAPAQAGPPRGAS